MICQVCNSPNPETAAACVSCGTIFASSPQPLERLPPGTKLSNGAYTIGKVLGQRGGFGITYKGSETVTARVVAIKEFFPAEGCVRRGSSVQPSGTPPATYAESLEEFLNEARTLASFDHPNIARVYFAFTENNTAYMVMEFLDGKTLQKIVDERGFLPVEEAVRYITAVARALEVVHAATIFHRDIKPENIIVTRDTTGAERVVLIDFGAAREFTAGKTRRLTQCLTPGYAPLEQYGAEGRFDQRTDIYALAATLYCLLTGQPPVDAPNRINGVELKSVGDLNIQVSAAVSAVVMRSLSISVKDRPLTVQAFLQSLNQALVGPTPVSASSAARLVPPSPANSARSIPPSWVEPTRQRQPVAPSQPAKGNWAYVAGAVGLLVLIGFMANRSHGDSSQKAGQSSSTSSSVYDGSHKSEIPAALPSEEEADRAIRKRYADWAEAYNGKNTAGVVAMLAPDYRYLGQYVQGTREKNSRTGSEDYYAKLFSSPVKTYSVPPKITNMRYSSDDRRYRCKVATTIQQTESTGEHKTIAVRQVDTWRYENDLWLCEQVEETDRNVKAELGAEDWGMEKLSFMLPAGWKYHPEENVNGSLPGDRIYYFHGSRDQDVKVVTGTTLYADTFSAHIERDIAEARIGPWIEKPRWANVGGEKATRYHYHSKYFGKKDVILYAVVYQGRGYRVLFVVSPSKFAKYKPYFDAILENMSFQ